MSSLNDLASEALEAATSGNFRCALGASELFIKQFPYYPAIHQLRCEVLSKLKENELLKAALNEWIALCPWNAEPRFWLGRIQLLQGEVDLGARSFDIGLSLVEPSGKSRKLPYGSVSQARLIHDAQQLEYLCGVKVLNEDDYINTLEAYRGTREKLFSTKCVDKIETLSAVEILSLSSFYRRCLFVYKEKAIGTPIRHPEKLNEILEEVESSGFCVVDDFLTQAALEEVVKYYKLSTIWHNDNQKGKGYLGAYQDSGGLSTTVSNIAKTITAATNIPELSQVWAYRNVLGTNAVGVHADFSRINCNIWVTPNQYNLNGRGGLKIYNKKAPDDWSFDGYNNDHERIESYLYGDKPSIIPYSCNRAVFFDSALFHGSDVCEFEPTYEGHRINITLLFGQRS